MIDYVVKWILLKKKVQILENENVNIKNLVQNLDLRIKELEKLK